MNPTAQTLAGLIAATATRPLPIGVVSVIVVTVQRVPFQCHARFCDPEPVTLTPSGENSLKGEAKTAIAGDATITLTIKTEAGKSGQVRFKK